MPRHTSTRKLQKRHTPMKRKRRNYKKVQNIPKHTRAKKMMMRESEMMHEPTIKEVRPHG